MSSFENRKYQESIPLKQPRSYENSINESINNFFHESIVTIGMGVSYLFKLLYRKPIITLIIIVFTVIAFTYFTRIGVIYSFIPIEFGQKIYDWIFQKLDSLTFWAQFSCLYIPFSLLCLSILGIRLRSIRTKYEKVFLGVGLKNHLGNTPKLISIRKIDQYRSEYTFDLNLTSVKRFEEKKDELEGAFKSSIERIIPGERHDEVKVVLTPHKLTEKITYDELKDEKNLPSESFYLGKSLEGVQTVKIEDLPHMMIAGTTNSGKSVFFKQALVGLLESTRYLQMYLIDMKNGLEFSDFKEAPNVRVFKDVVGAVNVLEQIKLEMAKRFEYMEENEIKKIIPGKHKFDRIVVAIDEASVVYLTKRSDKDHPLKLKARDLTDDLAKLARAAAIHLIFATQKITKEVIPTNIQENISARVAFKANTLQGSLIVVGNKEAKELPSIKGRGIWQFGSEWQIIQGPYIDGEDIKKLCKEVREEFKQGTRKLLNPLIGKDEDQKRQKRKTGIGKRFKEEAINVN